MGDKIMRHEYHESKILEILRNRLQKNSKKVVEDKVSDDDKEQEKE